MDDTSKKLSTDATDKSGKDTVGIVSIVLAFTMLQLVGLMIGIIGYRSAKKNQRSPKLSKIGIILNLVFIVLLSIGAVFLVYLYADSFPSEEEQAMNNTVVIDINHSASKLEEFYKDKGYYPEDINRILEFGAKPEILTDRDGNNYNYQPVDCSEQQCSRFLLSGDLIKKHNNYEVYSLNW